MKRTLKDRLILPAFIIILVFFALQVGRKYLQMQPTAPAPSPVAEAPKDLREVILYFSSSDANYLVAEARQLGGCLDDQTCMRETVRALLNGPLGNLVPVLPAHAVLNNIREEEGTAIVDFSREMVDGHPGGSVAELLTIYALADTLAVNFPYIRQVQVLIDGKAVDTLKGHLDLRQPIKADFSFVRVPGGDAVDTERVTPVPSAEEMQ